MSGMDARVRWEDAPNWGWYASRYADPMAQLEEWWAQRYDLVRCPCGGGPGTQRRDGGQGCWFLFIHDAKRLVGERYDGTEMTLEHRSLDAQDVEVTTQETNWHRHFLRSHLGIPERTYGWDYSKAYGWRSR